MASEAPQHGIEPAGTAVARSRKIGMAGIGTTVPARMSPFMSRIADGSCLVWQPSAKDTAERCNTPLF
jgi:hypothetical protein